MSTHDAVHVLTRFPSDGERVRELLRSSESFADLCADYEEVVAALTRVEEGALPDEAKHVAELRELREALAREIAQSLQDRAGESDAASS